jgi:hypothetical protein
MEDKMKKIGLYGFIMIILVLFAPLALKGNVPTDEETGGNIYIVILQLTDYNSKVADTVEYIFKDMIQPQDQLVLITPVKPYTFSQKTRQSQTPEQLIKLTQNVLKRDIVTGTANYHQILNRMTQLVLDIGSGVGDTSSGGGGMGGTLTNVNTIKNQLVTYRQLREEMKGLRKLDEKLFIKFCEIFKKGIIYVVYQQELQVIPNRDVMEALRNNMDVRFDAMEVFLQENTGEFLDVTKLSQMLSDAAITLHFFYIKSKETKRQGTEMKEFSNDVYNAFSNLAKTTGGIVETTSKPEAAFKKANETAK